MSTGVEEEVVRFDIAVDEAHLVDRVDGQRRLGHVELRAVFRQRVLLHQQRHHITLLVSTSQIVISKFQVIVNYTNSHLINRQIWRHNRNRFLSLEKINGN